MQNTEIVWVWLFPALVLGAGVALSFAFARWRQNWSLWRTSLVSAVILPLPILALGIWVFIDTLRTPAAACGIEACGLGYMLAMVFDGCAVALFLAGGVINYALHALIRRF